MKSTSIYWLSVWRVHKPYRNQRNMATMKPQKTKIEDAVLGTYQKIEDKFFEKFLEERDETDVTLSLEILRNK